MAGDVLLAVELARSLLTMYWMNSEVIRKRAALIESRFCSY